MLVNKYLKIPEWRIRDVFPGALIPDTTTKRAVVKKEKRKCKESQKAHLVRNKS
jgi:hypothetical protein